MSVSGRSYVQTLKVVKTNLNDLTARDFSTESNGVSVYFKKLEEHLVEHIKKADAVFGCVAWLTSEPILQALKGKQVAIVVQKEDFLRPDGDVNRWRQKLQKLYGDLHRGMSRQDVPGVAELCHGFGEAGLSYCGDPGSSSEAAIRCVGNHNADKSPAFPRSHHKFVVFGRYVPLLGAGDLANTYRRRWDDESQSEDGALEGGVPGEPPSQARVLQLYGVWTGSFNFTANASNSFENAVYLEDKSIVRAFTREFAQVFALSEPLDWESQWCEPQWRIGS